MYEEQRIDTSDIDRLMEKKRNDALLPSLLCSIKTLLLYIASLLIVNYFTIRNHPLFPPFLFVIFLSVNQ